MDFTKQLDRWRQVLIDRQHRSHEEEMIVQKLDQMLANMKAEAMEFLQPMFDEQAARITELVDLSHWERSAKPVRFHRRSLLQIEQPVHPLLPLGRVMTGSTASIQPYYDVYLTEDKRFFFEPCWHGMPHFSVEGDKYFTFSRVFDDGGLEDCCLILEFLEYCPQE